jgi:hypothetical protein
MITRRRLQWLCECADRKNSIAIEIVEHIESLEKALEDIKRHQEVSLGDSCKLSAAWSIANKVLEKAP